MRSNFNRVSWAAGANPQMNTSAKLLAEFDEEFANTRKFLDLVPDEKLTWKPHEKSMELGRLAWHISDFPEWCRDTLKRDVLKVTEEEGAKMAGEWQGKQRADMVTRFDRNLPEARSLLAKLNDADMAKPWKMEWAGQVIIDSPREEVLRKWVLNHMIHHRAQLGVYLRLNGIAIPGVYGPSADEMPG
jgi:uncharacterized damage-inducible protein DinB